MKKLILFLGIGLMSVSCNRDEPDNRTQVPDANEDSSVLPVKFIVQSYNTITRTFKYKNGNELEETVDDDANGNRVVYTYEGDFIVSKTSYDAERGNETEKTTYEYSNGKLVVATDKSENYNSMYDYKYTSTIRREYSYNGSTIVVRENLKETHPNEYSGNNKQSNRVYTYTLENGKVVKIKREIGSPFFPDQTDPFNDQNGKMVINSDLTYDSNKSPYKNIKGFSALAMECLRIDYDAEDRRSFYWLPNNPILIKGANDNFGYGESTNTEYKFEHEYKNGFPIKTNDIGNNRVITYEYNK